MCSWLKQLEKVKWVGMAVAEGQMGGHGSCRRSNGWAGQLHKVKLHNCNQFQIYEVTCSYSSRPFLWTLDHTQRVVTYMSPVEGLAKVIKILICKDCVWSFPSEAVDCLIFNGSKVKLQLHILDFCSLEVTLISSQKELWTLDSILILVTNASTWDT